MPNLRTTVIQAIAKRFRVDPQTVTNETAFEHDLGITDVQKALLVLDLEALLVLDLEDNYGDIFGGEDIYDIETVGDLIGKLLERGVK